MILVVLTFHASERFPRGFIIKILYVEYKVESSTSENNTDY